MRTAFFLILFCICAQANATPVIHDVQCAPGPVACLEKAELAFKVAGVTVRNPFDPAEIDVSAEFRSPTGRRFRTAGFWCQEYTRSGPPEQLAPAGDPAWKVRFAPDEPGEWACVLSVRGANPMLGPVTAKFKCAPSRRKGFARVSSRDPRYFEYSDGSQFVPIGHNMGWGNWGMSNGTYSYDTWLPRLAQNGGNYTRYVLFHEYHGIEWKETGLGDYTKRLDQAWRLDYALEKARALDVQVMLMLLIHAEVETYDQWGRWKDNPYNAANGGPCATPRDFFTDAKAKMYFKRYLRYAAARWGYASNLIWELFSEFDGAEKYINDPAMAAAVDAWIKEMSAYLRSVDPRHMITVSPARFQSGQALWSLPDISFAQYHLYSDSPSAEDMQAAVVKRFRERVPLKPVFGNEFGFHDGPGSAQKDPKGVQFHNGLWASLFSGAAGASALWWWADYIEPQDLYHHYLGLSRLVAALDFPGSGFVPARPAVTAAKADLYITGYFQWGYKPEASAFQVNADGTLTPGEDQLAQYIYDSAWNKERRNPPVFTVTFPADGFFRIRTGEPNGRPVLMVNVDGGEPEYNQAPPVNAEVSVPVKAGKHSIFVDNTGTGWVEALNYIFTGCADSLKVYALQGDSVVAAWIMDREYQWMRLRDKGEPAPAQGVAHFTGLRHDGTWQVEWLDTMTGAVTQKASAAAKEGRIDLDVPPVKWDLAVKLTYAGK